jgi:AraC family transcriptional regulator
VRVGLVYLRPRQVAFVRAHGAYLPSAVEAWQTMAEWLQRHDLTKSVNCGYGLSLERDQDDMQPLCRYDACVELPGGYENLKTDGLAFQMLPGGPYARIRHVGSYLRVHKSVAAVRREWLPHQPRLLIDRRRPLLVIYLDHPGSRDIGRMRSDVCVPVRTHYDDAVSRSKIASAMASA